MKGLGVKSLLMTAIFLVSLFSVLNLNAQVNGERPQRGTAKTDKSNDQYLKKLIDENLDKFTQGIYTDPKSGNTMEYNLFIPKNYKKGEHYPLVLFIADASTVNKEVTFPLTQGYGGLIWATDEAQSKHPSFVLVPQYKTKTVDDNFNTSYEVEMTLDLLDSIVKEYGIDQSRIYTTGQSMGGMMSMYFNVAHPDIFAASMYVGCQWDTSKMAHFANDKFLYIVAAGDEKAPKGMAALKKVLAAENTIPAETEFSAKLSKAQKDQEVAKLLSENNPINFITFTIGSVLPENGSGNEHMCSFDYAYDLEPARDWLFQQKK